MDTQPPTPSSLPENNSPESSTPPGSDEKIWIILSHLSLVFGVGIILPLIVYFVKKQEAPLTADHAKEALNFHLSVYFYIFISWLLCFMLIGFVLLPVVAITSVILSIIACAKAADGQFYRYPLTIRLI